LSNTPYREFKQWVHEGGIRTPLIAHWPLGIDKGGAVVDQVGHVIDIMPTLIELANTEYPAIHNGKSILPMEGSSLVSSLAGNVFEHKPLFWEHQATRAIRSGDWKLVADKVEKPPFVQPWELYNLENDPTESNDVANQHPDLVDSLSSVWQAWAERCNVLPLDGRGWTPRLEE
jgi:arylsulfatase